MVPGKDALLLVVGGVLYSEPVLAVIGGTRLVVGPCLHEEGHKRMAIESLSNAFLVLLTPTSAAHAGQLQAFLQKMDPYQAAQVLQGRSARVPVNIYKRSKDAKGSKDSIAYYG